MNRTDEAAFCCLTALVIVLHKKRVIDVDDYLVRIGSAGLGASQSNETEFADAIAHHIRTVRDLLGRDDLEPTETNIPVPQE